MSISSIYNNKQSESGYNNKLDGSSVRSKAEKLGSKITQVILSNQKAAAGSVEKTQKQRTYTEATISKAQASAEKNANMRELMFCLLIVFAALLAFVPLLICLI